MQGGVIVLDQATALPDGTPVTVHVESASSGQVAGQELEKLAGLADLPPDLAEKHDQYRRNRIAG